MKKNQQGFSVVEIILVILVVGLIAAVGWLVWDRQQENVVSNEQKSTETAQKTSETKANESASKSTARPSEVSTVKYLEIKEEGIKIKLSDKISDAYYEDLRPITFGVRSLDSISGCKPHLTSYGSIENAKGVAILGFDKYRGQDRTDKTPQDSAFKKDPYSVLVDQNWYAIYIDDSTECKSADSEIQNKIKSIEDAFKEASKTITAL